MERSRVDGGVFISQGLPLLPTEVFLSSPPVAKISHFKALVTSEGYHKVVTINIRTNRMAT
jgi:hypothetical protein